MGAGPAAVESVRLEPELERELLLRAAKDGISVSEVIRPSPPRLRPGQLTPGSAGARIASATGLRQGRFENTAVTVPVVAVEGQLGSSETASRARTFAS